MRLVSLLCSKTSCYNKQRHHALQPQHALHLPRSALSVSRERQHALTVATRMPSTLDRPEGSCLCLVCMPEGVPKGAGTAVSPADFANTRVSELPLCRNFDHKCTNLQFVLVCSL